MGVNFCPLCGSIQVGGQCTNKRCGKKETREEVEQRYGGSKNGKPDFEQLEKDEQKYGGGWSRGSR